MNEHPPCPLAWVGHELPLLSRGLPLTDVISILSGRLYDDQRNFCPCESVLTSVTQSAKTVTTACTEEQDALSSPTPTPTSVVAMRTQPGEDNANNQQRQLCI